MKSLSQATGLPHSLSPRQRAWQRFRRNRLGYWSLILFVAIFVLSLCAEVLSSNRPLVVRYKDEWYFPIVKVYPETTFDGISPRRRTTSIPISATASPRMAISRCSR